MLEKSLTLPFECFLVVIQAEKFPEHLKIFLLYKNTERKIAPRNGIKMMTIDDKCGLYIDEGIYTDNDSYIAVILVLLCPIVSLLTQVLCARVVDSHPAQYIKAA